MTGTTERRPGRGPGVLRAHWHSLAPLGLFALFGLWMTSIGAAERAVGEAPRVTPAELESHAGTGIPVLLVARAVAVPPLMAANGEELALQWVSLSHTETRGDRSETVTDYEALAPAEMWAAEGDVAVRVRTQGADPRYIAERVRGRTDRAGVLPNEALALMAGAFTDLPARAGLDVSIRSLGHGEPVAIHGVVELEGGEPVLRAPGDGRPFVVAGMSPDELVTAVGGSARFMVLGGWVVVAFSLLTASLAIWLHGRARASHEAVPHQVGPGPPRRHGGAGSVGPRRSR